MEIITLDIETFDPDIKEKGPGELRGEGRVLGCGIKIGDEPSEYILIQHGPYRGVPEKLNRLSKILASNVPKVGHNAINYDVPWLRAAGFEVNGKVHDTLIMAALIDEHAYSYSLDTLCRKYLGEGKGDEGLKVYAEQQGMKIKGPIQGYLEQLPVELVGEYCMSDVDQTKRLCDILLPELSAQGLRELYEMELALSPLLWKMRKTGIAINVPELENLSNQLTIERDRLSADLVKNYGVFNIRSGKQIAVVLEKMGVATKKTDKGNPKLGKEELGELGEVGKKILAVREVQTLLTNFVGEDGAFRTHLLNGRLHPLFLQTVRDEGGTVSGRLSAQKPNLTQVPARSEGWGKKIRSLFIPDEGMALLALDYDGIESRIFAHYASDGDSIRQAYIDDPDLDYHQAVADMAGIDRRSAKTINFAALYGAGVRKISEQLGRGEIEGRNILTQYHLRFPAVKATMQAVERAVRVNGYIRTIGGRKARLTPQMRADSKYYLFLNRLIQGSAADLLKKAMVDSWKAGVFEIIHPHLLVHDEVVGSIPVSMQGAEAAEELRHIMETAYPFRVPIKVSGGAGANWAEAH